MKPARPGILRRMKRISSFHLARTLAGVLFFCNGCASFRVCDDAWLGEDKMKHFAAGGVVGGASAIAASQAGGNDGEAALAAVAVTFSVGAGKELYDVKGKGTCWSWRDMAWNMAGALAGALVAAGVR